MSDKPKREITLGEIQDECADRGGQCLDGKNDCKYATVCPFARGKMPINIDLSDPPRFTEAQMAFLRAWYELGARTVKWNDSKYVYDIIKVSDGKLLELFGTITMLSGSVVGLRTGETLDLAEMFGKDKE